VAPFVGVTNVGALGAVLEGVDMVPLTATFTVVAPALEWVILPE
jgi:hypothetical protein